MAKEVISSNQAPKPIGPYSQATKVGNLVFLSGQIPLDPKTNEVVDGDIGVQARRVLDNIKAVLEAAGTSMDKVVKSTIFLKDMEQFGIVNSVYGEYFKEPYPARSTIQIARLPKDVGVEIEVIATID